ncbi:hypothetical protein TNCV_597101 [Trichonephila clavipes]|nr:hypothetical protein TNCV_597101 [Trichonephila clavipes]
MPRNQKNELQKKFFRASDCTENDTTMEDGSFRQESPVNIRNNSSFFLNLTRISLAVLKVFLTVLINNVWNIKKTNNGRSKILLDISQEFILNLWYDNQLFEKSYQEITPDNQNRNAVETGSYTRWNNQAYDSVHRGTDHGKNSNQEDIMDSNINLTWCIQWKDLDQVPENPDADLKRLLKPAMDIEDTVPKQTSEQWEDLT